MATEPHRDWLLAALQGSPGPFPGGHDPIAFTKSIMDDALEQGVATLLHSTLENAKARLNLPKELHTELKQHAQLTAAQELATAHEVQQVLTLFADHNFYYLLIKGVPLAYSIYPKPYLRTRSDTDIVFADKQTALAAWHLLEARGYHRPNAITGETISTQFICYRQLPANTSHTFDIHWRLNNSWRIADLLDFDELYSRAEPVPQLQPHARTPCAVDALIIACLHRIAHRPEQLHNRLIWLYDIHLLLTSFNENDWDHLVKRSREKGISLALLDGIHTATMHFNSRIPEALYEQLSEDDTKQSINVDDFRSKWRREMNQVRALPTMRLKLAHLKTNLFPSSDYLMKKYDVKRTIWIPWLYARRIVSGLAKRGR